MLLASFTNSASDRIYRMNMPDSINIDGLRFLNKPNAYLWLIALSVLLLLPSVFAGFFADDFSHYVLMQQKPDLPQPDNLSLLHLFSFTTADTVRSQMLMSHSLIPWWTDPEFSMVFFRPLAELASFVDYALWPQSPALMHIHSLLWWLAIMYLSWRVFTKLLHKPLAILALLLLAVDAAHGFTVAWIANRNALMAQTFSLLALLSFMQLHQSRHYLYLLYSTVAVAASLLSAEAGMTVGVLLAAYALFYSKQSWLWRGFSLLPALLVFMTWLLVYQAYGYGASGNNLYYVDPIASPVSYFAVLPERVLLAIQMLFNPVPTHFVLAWNAFSLCFGAVSLLFLLVYMIKRKQAHLYFAVFITLLSIIPAACTQMQERNLMFAAWAVAIIIADILWVLLLHWQSLKAKIAVNALFVGHVVLSAVLVAGMSYAPKLLTNPVIKQAQALKVAKDEPVILLGVPLLQASFITPIRRYLELESVDSLVNLTTTEHFEWRQVNDKQWLISHADGLLSKDDAIVRDFANNGFFGGEALRVHDFAIEVLGATKSHYPTSIRLTYLGEKNLRWLILNRGDQVFVDISDQKGYSQ